MGSVTGPRPHGARSAAPLKHPPASRPSSRNGRRRKARDAVPAGRMPAHHAERPAGRVAGRADALSDGDAGHPREGRENVSGLTRPWSRSSGYPESCRPGKRVLSALRAPLTCAREPDAKRMGISWRPGVHPDRAIGTASACRSRRMTSRSTLPIHPECLHPCRAASLRADARGERRTTARRRPAGSRGCRPGRRNGHTGRAPSAAWWGQELQSRIAFRVTPHGRGGLGVSHLRQHLTRRGRSQSWWRYAESGMWRKVTGFAPRITCIGVVLASLYAARRQRG